MLCICKKSGTFDDIFFTWSSPKTSNFFLTEELSPSKKTDVIRILHYSIKLNENEESYPYFAHVDLDMNSLSANPTKWSNTLKHFIGKLPTNCLCVFDHFVGLALKGLRMFLGSHWYFLHKEKLVQQYSNRFLLLRKNILVDFLL